MMVVRCAVMRPACTTLFVLLTLVSLHVLKKFVEVAMLVPQEHILQQIGEQIVIVPVALQSQCLAVLCI